MDQGVLLYYKYADLEEYQGEVHGWMVSLCQRLQLRGRVRVARDGLNCTVSTLSPPCPAVICCVLPSDPCRMHQVGGAMHDLHAHIAAVRQHPLLGADIDFKLAPSRGPRSSEAAAETGFTSLAVTLCKVRPPLKRVLATPRMPLAKS